MGLLLQFGMTEIRRMVSTVFLVGAIRIMRPKINWMMIRFGRAVQQELAGDILIILSNT